MIKVRYSAVDGFSETRKYKTLAGASKYATDRVGATPEMGSYYAVSGDGIGKVELAASATYTAVSGFTRPMVLADLFPALGPVPGKPALKPFQIWVTMVMDTEPGGTSWCKASFATYAEAVAAINATGSEYGEYDGVDVIGATEAAKAIITAERITPAAWGKANGCTCSEMQLNLVGCDCPACMPF